VPELAELTVRDVMRTSFQSVRPDERCSQVLSAFANDGEPAVVVTDDAGRYEGIASERDVLRRTQEPSKARLKNVLPEHDIPTVHPDDEVIEAVRLLLDANARSLAVVEKEDNVHRVQGILVREDIIHAAGETELGDEDLNQYTTEEVTTADAEDSVARALNVMRDQGISHLPVIEDGRLAGMVTTHDILRRVIAPMRGDVDPGWKSGDYDRPLGVPLHGIMTEPVVTLPRGSSYRGAADLIHGEDIGSVVVTKDGEFPYAIVTRRDLLEPIRLLDQDVRQFVVNFSSKDTSREGYETSGAPDEVRSLLERYGDRLEPALLQIHAKRHKDKNRKRELWHIRLNLTSDMGKFYAVGEGWGMKHATSLAVDHLQRKVRRAKEESLENPSREFIEEHFY
jgi:CBS domain-containing protein